MTDIDLAELLALDRDVAAELAEVSRDIATALIRFVESEEEPWPSIQHRRRRPSSSPRSPLPPGQERGHVNAATLRPEDTPALECATHFTRAATNYLLLGDTQQARDLFRQGAQLLRPYGVNDALVLATCADPGLTTDEAHEPHEPHEPEESDAAEWIQQTRQAIRTAAGNPDRRDGRENRYLPFHNPETAPTGTSTLEVIQTCAALSRTETAAEAVPLLARSDNIMVRASSRYVPAMESHGWASQDAGAAPLDPELLVLALLDAAWRRRYLPRDDDETLWFATGGVGDNPIAASLRVAAYRLLAASAPPQTPAQS